jgi:alpha-amylase/alpha-mannosidase (GH57 family)
MFRSEEPVQKLLDKARHFTELEKQALLDWQLELMGRIIPTYKKLQDEGRLEVSFTPYYHPILPLLCNTDAATETLPHVELPSQRFVHPEDAERQVSMAVSKYRELFGRDLVGMWPSEGSVSEEALAIMANQGIKWAASDEEVLAHSVTKSGLKQSDNRIHRLYEYDGRLKLLFRDHALSDRIGFVYSTWDADRAVEDFIDHLKRLRSIYIDSLDQTVIPIILDGENAWEYFPDDGREFLNLLYERLSADEEIEMLTLGEAAAAVPAQPLPRICAGSWINHNFRIWIGHAEDNAAWDLLSKTRDDLVSFEESHPDHDPEKLTAAWRQIYIAEGSDWCWWYGDDHRSEQNEEFDQIFRRHLVAVYELLGLDIPLEHSRPIYDRGEILEAAMPDALLTPVIDGRITHFYEWAGAGHFDCQKSGSAMHQVDRQIAQIFFAYDREQFYIRLDFRSKNELNSMAGLKAIVTLNLPESRVYELDFDKPQDDRAEAYRYAIDDVLEFSVRRDHLWPQEFGELGFTVSLVQGGQRLESWPEHEPLRVNLPRKFEEMFWPT